MNDKSALPTITEETIASMDTAAQEASDLLKVLSNPQRLRLLCCLLAGERSVGELEESVGATQSYVSGQLAKLRAEGIVKTEREGRIIRYRLADPRVTPIIERLYEVFCAPSAPQ